MKHTAWGFLFCIVFSACGSGNSSSNKNGNTENTTFPEAEKVTASIEKNPKGAHLYYERGVIYHGLKQDSLALLDFQKAVQLDSTKAEYFSAVGDLLFEHKDISGSIQWLQKSLYLNPDDEKAHLKMGKLFMFTEDYPKAFAEINTALRSNVYNAEAYFLKGMCYKSMKDTAKAISSFQTAVQTEPKYVDAHMQLAILFEAKKDPVALKYFENAYRADSSSLEPLYGEAMYWQNQENFTEAKKVFTRIISIDRTYPTSYYNMGWMLMQEDSTEKAIRQFGIAIQVKPDYFQAYYNRGLCHEILGDIPKAIEDYKQSLSFNPDYAICAESLKRAETKNKK
jgi:tetratricopeptide (TPR) repeat protein